MAIWLGDWESPRFQGNNITPSLAALGLKNTSPIKDYYDYSADLGGRIIRDKLWFYGGLSKQTLTSGQLGVVSGPDAAGCWTCLDAPGGKHRLDIDAGEHQVIVPAQFQNTVYRRLATFPEVSLRAGSVQHRAAALQPV